MHPEVSSIIGPNHNPPTHDAERHTVSQSQLTSRSVDVKVTMAAAGESDRERLAEISSTEHTLLTHHRKGPGGDTEMLHPGEIYGTDVEESNATVERATWERKQVHQNHNQLGEMHGTPARRLSWKRAE